MISSDSQLAEILPRLRQFPRVAVDTEADSLHCYFEKLCLIQLTFDGEDILVDPLSGKIDLQPLCTALSERQIVLQGMDFDLRLLRRAFDLPVQEVFDTVIASRMIGLREFSLAALVQQYFDVTLAKGSQKANWARRPLPPTMETYAKNDTHFLLPLAAKMEEQMSDLGRLEWFRQSCQRALEQTLVSRERDPEEAWRITGSGTLPPREGAVLRAIWRWRDGEARQADRPSFHILQNSAMLDSAKAFAAGDIPEFPHLSDRRRRGFLAAAQEALELPESAWPQRPPRGTRTRTPGFDKKVEELRRRRDQHAKELALDPAFIAPRSALEGIAADPSRCQTLLVQWQRDLLGL
ncbi:MAG: HRDC domain-containing protein [Verrucomicrobiota bacterium]|nr:HRDC domain-containing protein [Verrucomicrobiota bacterium]